MALTEDEIDEIMNYDDTFWLYDVEGQKVIDVFHGKKPAQSTCQGSKC